VLLGAELTDRHCRRRAKETARAYGVLRPLLGVANRWTFYIDVNGRVAAIDKQVNPATSAEDLAAKLHDLGVPVRR
jgi:peroxiredoxin Q/BCP